MRFSHRHTIQAHVCQNSKILAQKWVLLCMDLYSNPVGRRMRKLLICTFSAFCYMFIVSLGGYNSQTTKDVTLKFSAFLNCVVTTCVKSQIPRYNGFKVGILRISSIREKDPISRKRLPKIRKGVLPAKWNLISVLPW